VSMFQPERILLPSNGYSRALFFAGKGGVGKTTVSSAVALRIAECGYRTLLVTTDPAAHIGEVFEQPVSDEIQPVRGVKNLFAVRIDPKAATEAYKRNIIEDARPRYSPEMLAALAEELESPCTEEMAAFDKFSQFLTDESFQITVFDTAPTGHTLRLLQLPFDYSAQVGLMVATNQESVGLKDKTKARFEAMIAKLRDPARTTFAFVVYPESTPVMEAYRAKLDLEKAGIRTQLVVANQVLPAERCSHPFFKKRSEMQKRYLGQIAEKFAVPMLEMPLFAQEVIGLQRVREAAESVLRDCCEGRPVR
jgi:arsenite-transporting ATPase